VSRTADYIEALAGFCIDPPAVVWPLSFVLIALLALHRFFSDVRPIFVTVVQGVTKNAQSNAPAYAMAIGFGLSASLMALATEAEKLGWLYIAAGAKVLNPFIAGCVAYATQNKFIDPSAPPPEKKPNPPTT
jgi:hypothetical protein